MHTGELASTTLTSQVILFNLPRSGSHLLSRMLGQQSSLKPGEDPFSGARWGQLEWLRSESYADGMPPTGLSAFTEVIQKDVEKWRSALEETQSNGKILFLHAETYFPASPERHLHYMNLVTARQTGPPDGENFTLVPDNLLLHLGTVPILTIRDPRLACPSAMRVLKSFDIPHGGGRPNYLTVTTCMWNRLLYDFYVSHGVQPIIADADDYMTSEDFVRHLCAKAGLDPAQAQFSWPEPSKEEKEKLHPMYYASQRSLVNSSRMNPAMAAKNTDLVAEEKEWDAEFGEDAAMVREMVDLAMPGYEYLYERRLKLGKGF